MSPGSGLNLQECSLRCDAAPAFRVEIAERCDRNPRFAPVKMEKQIFSPLAQEVKAMPPRLASTHTTFEPNGRFMRSAGSWLF